MIKVSENSVWLHVESIFRLGYGGEVKESLQKSSNRRAVLHHGDGSLEHRRSGAPGWHSLFSALLISAPALISGFWDEALCALFSAGSPLEILSPHLLPPALPPNPAPK